MRHHKNSLLLIQFLVLFLLFNTLSRRSMCCSHDTKMRRVSGSYFGQVRSEGPGEVLACEVSHVSGLRCQADRQMFREKRPRVLQRWLLQVSTNNCCGNVTCIYKYFQKLRYVFIIYAQKESDFLVFILRFYILTNFLFQILNYRDIIFIISTL